MTARRLTLVMAAVVGALLAGFVATAMAADERVATKLEVYTLTGGPDTLFVLGQLDADDGRCIGNRRVSIDLSRQGGGSFAFDTARTSDNGGWGGARLNDETVDKGPFTKIVVEAKQRKLKISKRKSLICKSAKFSYPLTD